MTALTLPQSSQSTKREAQPGSAVIGDLIGEDASVRATVLLVDLYDGTDTSNRTRLFRSALPAQSLNLPDTLQTEVPGILSRAKMAKLSVLNCDRHIYGAEVSALLPANV
jgi:hypothetical protein